MSIRRMNWIVVAAVVVLSGGFAFGVLMPGFKNLQQKRTELSTLSSQAVEQQRQLGNIGELYSMVVEMNDQMRKDRRRLPPERQFGEFLNALSEQFKLHNIENYTVQPLPEQALDEARLPDRLKSARAVALLPVTISFECGFTQAFAFIKGVEDLPRLSHVQSLKVVNDEMSPGKVKAELVLHAYYRPERDASNEKNP